MLQYLIGLDIRCILELWEALLQSTPSHDGPCEPRKEDNGSNRKTDIPQKRVVHFVKRNNHRLFSPLSPVA